MPRRAILLVSPARHDPLHIVRQRSLQRFDRAGEATRYRSGVPPSLGKGPLTGSIWCDCSGDVCSGTVYHQGGLSTGITRKENRMSKFAIRLLTLAMFATAQVVVPMVTPVKAATNSSKEIKKKKRMTQRSPAIANARPPNPFPPMHDDPDRRAGGGGGY